jgi:hypothetical protein
VSQKRPRTDDNSSAAIVNDVVLPKCEGFGENHFVIRYCPEKNNYVIKDLG